MVSLLQNLLQMINYIKTIKSILFISFLYGGSFSNADCSYEDYKKDYNTIVHSYTSPEKISSHQDLKEQIALAQINFIFAIQMCADNNVRMNQETVLAAISFAVKFQEMDINNLARDYGIQSRYYRMNRQQIINNNNKFFAKLKSLTQ
jgi:hypothetical protein